MFMTKKDVAWLFACIVLGALLAVSLALGLTGFFSSATYLYTDTDLKVGDTINIAVKPNQAAVAALTFDGAYLPNEKIPQTIQINAENLNTDVYVRVKSKVFGKGENHFDFVASQHFEKAEDGYYYYDQALSGGNKITFCTYLLTPEDGTYVSQEKYVLSVIVETLETKYDKNIWKIA